MTRTLQLPDVRRILDGLERRLSILERRIRDIQPADVESEIIFSLAGTVTESTSPNAYLRRSSRLVGVVCSLSTAGSTTTTVEVEKNGSTVATVNLGSGVTLAKTSVSAAFVQDSDALSVTVSADGVGASGLTVQTRFS